MKLKALRTNVRLPAGWGEWGCDRDRFIAHHEGGALLVVRELRGGRYAVTLGAAERLVTEEAILGACQELDAQRLKG